MTRLNLDGIINRTGGEKLAKYNTKILQCQEEVYNLAAMILDDERLAAVVVDSVIRSGYSHFSEVQPDFRLYAICQVLKNCLAKTKGAWGPKSIRSFLAGLSEEQKIAIILVDCLEMSYQDAATIIEVPEISIRKILATARYYIHESMTGLPEI
jgi:hypothetical protein